jgi:uncharacterized membrane protein YeaQ/YmgE (transglycosylase-associated protein family)
MALKSYVLNQDFATPYVIATGMAHNPQQIKVKKFKKGDIVKGELKHANNQPAFVLVQGTLVLPLEVIKELVTKAIIDNDTPPIPIEDLDMISKNSDDVVVSNKKKSAMMPLKSSNPKVNYIDSMIIGGIAGLGAMYLVKRQNWIEEFNNKYYLYAGLVGASLGAYIVYRVRSSKTEKMQITKAKKQSANQE